ncbi:lipopolysaccharide export system protein LptA [Cohaesibacter sp. ES.047]|uniref:LptA/OstA family protein n=1 Tax=Cohaesibacter sp. ES.047 TaxID=1798205 RepID=UPI000BB8A820|nr:LptA/OstA family protein [Cohaesibacter sp. ES.047]SNY91778.1 lipopolysaccharide export system protein LptA [Cohaesibacter sp. ES.047]
MSNTLSKARTFIGLMLLLLVCLSGALFMLSSPSSAQGMTDVVSGLRTDPDAPIEIEADQLDIFDKKKVAIFKGRVVARQGDTLLNTASLTIHYSGGGAGTAQSITRLEANGGVKVSQKDQNATGDTAFVDMAKEVITLSGNVVLTQGGNVLRGTKLTINMRSGAARLAANTNNSKNGGSGRVQGLFIPKKR